MEMETKNMTEQTREALEALSEEEHIEAEKPNKECPGKSSEGIISTVVLSGILCLCFVLSFTNAVKEAKEDNRKETLIWTTSTTQEQNTTCETSGVSSQASTVQSFHSIPILWYIPGTKESGLSTEVPKSEENSATIIINGDESQQAEIISQEPIEYSSTETAEETSSEQSQTQPITSAVLDSSSDRRVDNYTYESWDAYYEGLYNCDGYSVSEENLHGFSEFDILLLRKIVSSEYGGAFVSVRDKAMVVCGVINQLRSGQHGNTILACLEDTCEPWGFNPWGNYTIDQSIVDAVEYCFQERMWETYNHCGWSGWGTLGWDWPWYGPWPNDYMLEGV